MKSIPDFKQGLNDFDIITNLFSKSVKNFRKSQNAPSEIMETSTTSSNPIVSGMFRISIMKKQVWI